MKKVAFLFALSGILLISNTSFAQDAFDRLENITPAQRQQISTVQNTFKIKNNELEMRISGYTDKIARLKADTDKTQDQISLLIGAYERNITTLKSQQEVLKKETDDKYKEILTEEQYKQYQALQINVQDSFNKFLQK